MNVPTTHIPDSLRSSFPAEAMSATTSSSSVLKRTPLHDIHAALGAKIVPFAGYEMPVQYPAGITAEHKSVREGCGMFDVSHMGEFWVTGDGAVDFVNYVTTNDVAALAVGQVHYSTILNERGTIEDDCLVYRFADQRDDGGEREQRRRRTSRTSRGTRRGSASRCDDASDEMALLALQGPKARRFCRR